MDRVCDPMREKGLHAAVGQQDLGTTEIARRRIPLLRGSQIVSQLTRDPSEGSKPEHGSQYLVANS